jgi:hypothetical protein
MVGTVKKVDRHRVFHMVFQEGPPCLRRRVPTADHVFAHAGLADVNAEFEEFTVDARSAPNRILAAHLANQSAYFLRHRLWFSETRSMSALPRNQPVRSSTASTRGPEASGGHPHRPYISEATWLSVYPPPGSARPAPEKGASAESPIEISMAGTQLGIAAAVQAARRSYR